MGRVLNEKFKSVHLEENEVSLRESPGKSSVWWVIISVLVL